MMNLLIVEDDFLNRRHLIKSIDDVDLNIIESSNYDEAVKKLLQNNISIVLLDINLEMEGKSGIELASLIEANYQLPVIFITAYTTHETIKKATATSPIAYLTKPINKTELAAAIALAKRKVIALQELQNSLHQFLLVKEDGFTLKILFNDIHYCTSEGNYVIIKTATHTYRYRATIKTFLDLLPKGNFVQIHRAYIVNVKVVKKISSKTVDIGKEVLPVSKQYIHKLQALYIAC